MAVGRPNVYNATKMVCKNTQIIIYEKYFNFGKFTTVMLKNKKFSLLVLLVYTNTKYIF